MTIYLPDPHPGRCFNYRLVNGQTLRCLDYEGTRHVCDFPGAILPFQWPQGNQMTSSNSEAEPWVKP